MKMFIPTSLVLAFTLSFPVFAQEMQCDLLREIHEQGFQSQMDQDRKTLQFADDQWGGGFVASSEGLGAAVANAVLTSTGLSMRIQSQDGSYETSRVSVPSPSKGVSYRLGLSVIDPASRKQINYTLTCQK